ncbi:MAG: DUF3035 domain-containing protein [Rhodobacteraceae bacterium]|nr:MAG: DUF3035 domain-containing protein [Paracoccaceae bacterium]
MAITDAMSSRRTRASAAIVIVAVSLLAACSAGSGGGGFRQSIGLETPPPDATLVVARRPLQAPPDFATLPPPRPGAPSRVERDPQAEAAAALLGGAPTQREVAPAASRGEAALLAAAGADAADPAIRQIVVDEASPPDTRFALRSILGFPIPDPVAEAERLSAEEEAQRLRDQGFVAPGPPSD